MIFRTFTYFTKDRIPLNNPGNAAHGKLGFEAFPFQVNLETKTQRIRWSDGSLQTCHYDESEIID